MTRDLPYIEAVYMAWTAGRGPRSWLIRHVDRSRTATGQHPPAAFNHVLLRFVFPSHCPDLIYESTSAHGVAPCPVSHLRRAMDDGTVTRYHQVRLDVLPFDRFICWHRATLLHARGYDYRLLPLYYAGLRVFRRWPRLGKVILRLQNPDRLTCNEFVTHCTHGLIPELPAYADPTSHTPETLFQALHGVDSATYIKRHPQPEEP